MEPIYTLVPRVSSKKRGRSESGNIHSKNCQVLAPKTGGTVDRRVAGLPLHCLWWYLSQRRIIMCTCYNLAYFAENCQLKDYTSRLDEKQFSDVQEMDWPKASEIEVHCGWFARQACSLYSTACL